MGVTISNKEISAASINCGGSFSVRLSLTAEPDIVSNPTDIVLVLDRSGSMTGSPLANLKAGANKFIDIIDEATDGSQDGQIGNGSRIGIVSFATAASQDTQLITSVAELKAAVDALDADGNTNHADAFTNALQLYDPNSTNAKVMVMFTDGETTIGGNPTPVADLAKSQGVIIYMIGLNGDGGLNEAALDEWASDPSSAYVAITPDDAELEDLFENLARNISNPGATDVVITDTVNDCFRITDVGTPSKGTAELLSDTRLRWSIDELGVTQSEAATLDFDVEHSGDCEGTVEVNADIDYSDAEGNAVSFPSPEIEVNCDIDVYPESCPLPVDIEVDGCEDSIEFDAGDLAMESLGRILQMDVTLKNVCPNRRVALAAIVSEVDSEGIEYKRGLKTMTIPAHNRDSCQDVTVHCIKFVLPEDLSVAANNGGICSQRNFRARFIAHYVDHDFDCCNVVL